MPNDIGSLFNSLLGVKISKPFRTFTSSSTSSAAISHRFKDSRLSVDSSFSNHVL